MPGEGRNADVFIFAWHCTTGADCEHADPAQWEFFVVSEAALPAQKSLGLRKLARLTSAVDFSGLGTAVQAATIARQALYKSLGEDGNPTLSTLLGVFKSLGLSLAVKA